MGTLRVPGAYTNPRGTATGPDGYWGVPEYAHTLGKLRGPHQNKSSVFPGRGRTGTTALSKPFVLEAAERRSDAHFVLARKRSAAEFRTL